MSRWHVLEELMHIYDGQQRHNDEKAFLVSRVCFLEEKFMVLEGNQVEEKDFFLILLFRQKRKKNSSHIRQLNRKNSLSYIEKEI